MLELQQEYMPEPIESPYPSIIYEAYKKERAGLFKNTGPIVDINIGRNKIIELYNKYDRMAIFINKMINK